jgi:hypothetical protein
VKFFTQLQSSRVSRVSTRLPSYLLELAGLMLFLLPDVRGDEVTFCTDANSISRYKTDISGFIESGDSIKYLFERCHALLSNFSSPIGNYALINARDYDVQLSSGNPDNPMIIDLHTHFDLYRMIGDLPQPDFENCMLDHYGGINTAAALQVLEGVSIFLLLLLSVVGICYWASRANNF